MNGYVCLFNGKRFECYAKDLYDAKLQAIQYFQPAKSKAYMVTVTLAEKAGETVIHTAD